MQISVEEVSSVVRRLKIDVDADRVKQEIDKVARDVSKRVRMPGFRPGKAPRGMIEKRFWPEISQQVIEKMVEGTLYDAVQEKDIPIVATTGLKNVGTLKKGENFNFEVEIEVKPTIALGDYKGLKGKKPVVEATEEEINDELENMRKQHRNIVVVEDRTVTESGDLLVMDYTITEDGEVLSDQMNATFPIGDGHFLPDNEALLIGKEVPSSLTEEVVYPDDFKVKGLAGKSVTLEVELKEIKKEELPEINDALAEDAGEENLAALKETIKKRIIEGKDKEARKYLEEKIYDALLANHEFEVPMSMIQQRAERMVQGTWQQLAMYNPGMQNQLSRQLMAELAKSSHPQAERDVRISLLMNEISKAESIEADDEAVTEELKTIAESSGQMPEKVRAEFEKENAIEGLKLMLAKRKTMDFLIENADIESISAEEMQAEAEKKAAAEKAAMEAEQAAAEEPAAEEATEETAE